jgi:hemerythrin-like domain-containing protein/DNA-directed RNA polymerase subunit RPC12/RpoP
MAMDKSCPGSRTIREPRPEYMNCPKCGKEVEIWTDELKATCRNCGTKVLRAQQASCIEWCPHAKECVGPEVYERLMAGGDEDLADGDSPLEVLRREHDRAQEKIALLRAASLCLKLGAATTGSPIWGKGVDHLAKVVEFIDKDVRLHFHREEVVLFPVLEKHLGTEKSPTRLLLDEHSEIWQSVDQLKVKLAELKGGECEYDEALAAQVQDISGRVEHLLKEHIKKENESLLPLAKGLLNEAELKEFSEKWKSVSLETGSPVKI